MRVKVKSLSQKLSTYLFLLFIFCACKSEHERFLEKAEYEALRQNSQLAKYLYGQVIESRREKDETRYRALKGLAEVSLTQLFDYPTAAKAFEAIFDEYEGVESYKDEIRSLRIRAAKVYRINLEAPDRALDVLSPLIPLASKRIEEERELGETYLALGNYAQAKQWFLQAWDQAKTQSSCSDLRDLQLSVIQVYSLQELCEDALKWTQASFPKDCEPDYFAVSVEKAHCYEMSGEVAKALRLYEELVEKNPQNMRAYFFLENLKRRQKEKQTK